MRKPSKEKLREPAHVERRLRKKRGKKKITIQIRVLGDNRPRYLAWWITPDNVDKDGWGTYRHHKYKTLRAAEDAVATLSHSSFEAQHFDVEFRVDPKFKEAT